MNSRPQLHGLFVYPVKSCRGIALTEARLTATGLAHDREWMVVDPEGRFITQRDTPALALVGTALSDAQLHLSTPDGASVSLSLDHEGQLSEVGVWRSRVPAFDAGAAAVGGADDGEVQRGAQAGDNVWGMHSEEGIVISGRGGT